MECHEGAVIRITTLPSVCPLWLFFSDNEQANEGQIMRAKLFCKIGQLAGAEYQIADEATVGKSAGNAITLYPQTVSGKHARIFFEAKEQCYFVEDLGSRNGTKVDGVRIRTKARLERLHVITFANDFEFIFIVLDETPATPPQKDRLAKITTRPAGKTETEVEAVTLPPMAESVPVPEKSKTPERKTQFEPEEVSLPDLPLPGNLPAASTAGASNDRTMAESSFASPRIDLPEPSIVYMLEFKDLPGGTRAFTLKEGENAIGRSSECEICINDASLSRRHAVITIKAAKATIKDLDSKNKTFIAGQQRVEAEIELYPDTTIAFGLVEAKFLRQA